MWIVYDNEEGLVGVYDNHDEALKEYTKCKNAQMDWVHEEGGFSTDETVILAKVEKHFYGYETDKKAIDYDENGEEFETDDNCWDWKEDTY